MANYDKCNKFAIGKVDKLFENICSFAAKMRFSQHVRVDGPNFEPCFVVLF